MLQERRVCRAAWSRAGSGPGCENLLRFGNLCRRAGEMAFNFAGFAGDVDLDGVQAAVFHPQVELFVNFPGAVRVETIGHP